MVVVSRQKSIVTFCPCGGVGGGDDALQGRGTHLRVAVMVMVMVRLVLGGEGSC